jgi:microsomal dipeptidase-like Zn-dependent dipeptidase
MHFNNNYVDFHCHPAMKPFGESFNKSPVGINSEKRNNKQSIWRYDPPILLDKLMNYLSGLTKFSQSNFSSLVYGGVEVVCVSLYPLEKWFVRNQMKNEILLDLGSDLAMGIGKKRIDHIQAMTDYFEDLEREYDFYLQLDGKVIQLPEGKFRYKLVKNHQEIKAIRANQPDEKGVTTVCVIMSIEGMHVLNTGLGHEPNEAEVLANLDKIKNWKFRPLFVTFTHHFWNHLCGHSESLSGFVKDKADQTEGMNTGFTSLGLKVLRGLLDNTGGKRILIDTKHMSPKARQEYFSLLDSGEFGNAPIIVSHGACNGMRSSTDSQVVFSETGNKLNHQSINFYDDELVRIANSGGILALQLDERRIANDETLKNIPKSVKRHKIMHYRSALLWNQVQHVLEVCDMEGVFAWDCMAMGTDFDGIIDPLNSFWTSEEFPYLADFLERHAYSYMKEKTFKNPKNKINADEIVDRIMSTNGLQFFEKNFV